VAALAKLSDIKAVARGHADIQAISENDPLVKMVLGQVEREASAAVFGDFAFDAQSVLAAHYLSLALGGPNAHGALVSEAVGGVSQGWIPAWETRKDHYGATIYGMQFLSYRRKVVVPATFAQPAP
jgi:hypothetical protein